MRVYLDTNILVFLTIPGMRDELSADVSAMFDDYESQLLTSTICVQELIHLIQIGKVKVPGVRDIHKASTLVLNELGAKGVTIVPPTEIHIREMAELPLYDDHRDPSDRLIISQAMSDHIPIVSSDRKFERYTRYGLRLIVNRR